MKTRWSTFFEQLVNVENERTDRVISRGVERQVASMERGDVVTAWRRVEIRKAT